MVNLALTPDQAKEEYDINAEQPKYPYGTSLYIDEDIMAKLGMTELPKVGSQIKISAMATVTSVSQRQEANGETCQNVELQITDMELGAPQQTKTDLERANMLYGGDAD